MVFFGNSVRAIIVWGIVVVAIMLVSYFVIVKPILDDTDEQIDRAFDQSEQIQEEAFESAEEIQESVQQNIDESLEQGSGGGGAGAGAAKDKGAGVASAQVAEANKLLDCISEASGDVDAIQACNEAYAP
jgi:hypothetical protein